jgi:hypothetical protein
MVGSLALAALALNACGSGAATAPAPKPTAPEPTAAAATAAPVLATPGAAPAADQLFVRDGYDSPRPTLRVLGGAAEPKPMPLGAPSPDWSQMYMVRQYTSNGGNATIVRVLDPRTGAVLRETTVGGMYELPAMGLGGEPGGLSPDGRWLTLQAPGAGHPRSRLLVLDTAFAQAPRAVELDGRFEFDGIGNDGAALFLTEYPNPASEDSYQIRLYNMGAGALDPNPVVMKGEGAQISGVRRMALPSADGSWLYSLYVNDGHSFIHALNLAAGYAICIDLPGEGGFDQQLLWSMALGADGTLYAANGALGEVAAVDTRQDAPQITRSARLPAAPQAGLLERVGAWLVPVAEAKRIAIGGAALSPDGATLYTLAERGLLAIDTRDLTLRARLAGDLPLDSVALSADGARLYVVSAERRQILRLDAASGAELGSVAGASRPWGVLRVMTADR